MLDVSCGKPVARAGWSTSLHDSAGLPSQANVCPEHWLLMSASLLQEEFCVRKLYY